MGKIQRNRKINKALGKLRQLSKNSLCVGELTPELPIETFGYFPIYLTIVLKSTKFFSKFDKKA